ncbi:MAG: DUF4397 domain-containing protein [Candidatus Latescibacterota bacterium]|nr:MAG: DUF4397 domain-containing protein [Candidatus Latescibacterota bacterium]
MPGETGNAYVRVAHLSPDAPDVDVWVDGAVVLEDVPFEAFSAYLALEPGDHTVQVTPAGQSSPVVIDADVTLTEDVYYTVAATGRLAGIEGTVLVDDRAQNAGQARVRFVHTSPDAPAVDITLTDGTALFRDVSFRETGGYIAVPAGAYDLQVRVAGTETVALSFGDVPLSGNTTYSVFAVGLLGDGSIAGRVAVDSPGDGNTTIGLEPASASLRVAHLSPDAPSVDIYLDDLLVAGLAGVPFKAVSGYLSASAATHNVKVFVSGTSTNPVIEADLSLLPGFAYTVAATGLVGQGDLSPLVLVDDRDGTVPGSSKIRFVHASPDAPSVNIQVAGGPTLFTGVEFREAAGYAEVAAGAYDLEVRLASGGALALAVPGVDLMGSSTYTAFAVGLAGDGTLDALLVEDTP